MIDTPIARPPSGRGLEDQDRLYDALGRLDMAVLAAVYDKLHGTDRARELLSVAIEEYDLCAALNAAGLRCYGRCCRE